MILGLVLVTSASAQVAVGVRAGYNNSTLSITPEDPDNPDFKSRSGFNAGADLAFWLSPMFAIEAGAAYSQKGATAAEAGIEGTFAINYLDVPALFAVYVPTGSNLTFRLFAGGVASFEMSCKVKLSVPGEASVTQDCDDENVGARKKFYFSIPVGGGVGFPVGPGSLLLDLDYQIGLTNLSDETGETAKLNVFQVSLGYRFPLGS
jgi:hypothetical protein